MKSKKSNLLVLAIITLAMLMININNADSKVIQKSKTITIELNSMQCDMCVEKVTDAINSVEGVEIVSVDLDKKSAIVKAITLAGYDANKAPADKEAYDNLSSCCKKQ